MKSHITKKFLRKILSSFHLSIFPFSQQASLRSEVSHCRFEENCVSKLNTEEKSVTLWVTFTHRNAVPQKASFQFSSEDISFFTIAINELQISLCSTQDNRVSKLFQKGKGGTLHDEVTHQEAISKKASTLVLIWGYFLFHHGPLRAPKSHFGDSTKRELANCFLRTKL